MRNNLKQKIRIEDDLILCCTQNHINSENKNRMKKSVQGDIDWNYLILSALKHKVIQLLYFQLNKICPEDVPQNILNILRENYNEQTRYNLFLSAELFQILKLFKSHEITVTPYKGPLFVNSVYKNLSLREMNNLDLIIRKEDAIKTKEMLLSHGYRLKSRYDPHIKPNFRQSIPNVFFSENSTIPIYVRWDYLKNSFSSPHDLGELWNFIGKQLYDVNVDVFSNYAEDMLLIFCIQCAYYQWDRLSDIYDIAKLIHSSDNLNWEKILDKSKKFRIERILFINLFLVNYLFKTGYPGHILHRIKSDEPTEIISRYLIRKLFLKKDYLINKGESSVFYYQIRENRFDWIRDFLKSSLTPETEKVVPFVKTPHKLIRTMLKFAAIGPEDVVYDLGCGDGRIVITAAKEYGVKGVGIDIDTQCIINSKKNATKKGVESQTTFLQQDIMKADLSEATLITLYLTPSINIKIRSKLQKELKPGTRIVSKDFDLGEWTPLKTDITFYNGHIVPFYLWKT